MYGVLIYMYHKNQPIMDRYIYQPHEQGSLYYQPKQCTIVEKFLKFAIDLHQIWSSQNG